MKFRNPFQSPIVRYISKEAEYQLYEKVATDIENNNIQKGVWAKALSEADGDEIKQKAIYIELMVENYKDLIKAGEELEEILSAEFEREAQEEELQKRRKEMMAREEEEKTPEAEKERRRRREEWETQYEKDVKKAIVATIVIFLLIVLVALLGSV
tara:strand:+ start:2385 stop:2852 length:468 start_codon:yes stop_codon:yes gene_type:complete